MKNIYLKTLRLNYLKIKNKQKKQTILIRNTKEKKFLELSIFNNRDAFEFDNCNYTLIKNLLKENNFHELKKTNYFLSKYIKCQYEFKYLPKLGNVFNYIKVLVKYFIFISDLLIIFLFNFLYIIKRRNKSLVIKHSKNIDQVFSIFYWESKKESSVFYYYPKLKNHKNYLCFITSFVDIRLISLGLLKSRNKKNIISSLDILNINDLVSSIRILFNILTNDILIFLKSGQNNLIKFFISWQHISKIYYNILIYLSLKRISLSLKNVKYINWGENQNHLKAFALGVIFLKENTNNLVTFVGSPISINYREHLVPNKEEVSKGLWGNEIYLQTEKCLDELKNYFYDKNIYLDIKKCSKDNLRSEIKNHLNKKITSNQYTLFSHDSYWDLESCFYALILYLEENIQENNNKLLIYIRLHPSLDISLSKKKLLRITKSRFMEKISISFIKEGSIKESINSSEICIFGESSHINYAISQNKIVLCCQNNHRFLPPIYKKFLNYDKLTFIEPW